MIRGRNRASATRKPGGRRSRDSGGTSRLAEVVARIDSARNTALARRPIFDRKLEVVAYEVVLGDGPITEIAIEEDGDGSHRRLVVNGGVELDIAEISAGKPVQLAVASGVLASGLPPELGANQVVLLLGSSVDPAESVLAALEKHRSLGYRIVLDDLAANPHLGSMLRLADSARVNYSASVAPRVALLKESGVDLVADNIGSYEELRNATKAGFNGFQGSFLDRPDGFRKTKATTGQIAALELITLLQDPEAEISDIADVIRRDVSLSYRILKVVNSAHYSLPRPLGSIEEAVVLVGTKQIVSWVGMLSMSGINKKPSELTRSAMVRARTCERLAECLGRSDTQRFYLVGLLSVIDALLDVPAEQALRQLPLATEIVDGITSGNGIMGEVLRGVVAYEAGAWSRAHIIGVPDEVLSDAYHLAILETDKVWSQITGSVG